jgi:ribosomal protein S17E
VVVLGRTKGTHIRRIAKELVKKYPLAFTASFYENKAKLVKTGLMKESKRELNKLAGEVAVEVKKATAANAQEGSA